jgi:tetratricopeptide (TPR) repeat protein
MRKIIFILLFSVFLSTSLIIALLLSSGGRNLDRKKFNTGNNLYLKGNYDEAIQIYENLAIQNQTHSGLYFNLGNAYYKKGDTGRALVNYKRALRLDPRDPDIRRNIRIIQIEKNNSVIEPDSLRGPGHILADLTDNFFSINETSIITLGLWFLIIGLIMLFRMSEYQKIRVVISALLIIFTILFFITGLSLGSRIVTEIKNPSAVVTAEEIPLKSQPDNAYKTEYSLKNGSEVFFIETQGEWVKLSTTNNAYKGWVPATSIERISNIIPPLGL